MKIAILFESQPSGGGSFSHSLNVCINIRKYLDKKHEFIVYTNFKKNYDALIKLNIPCIYFKYNFLDKLMIKLSQFSYFRIISNFLSMTLSLEKKFLKDKIDLIYFPVISGAIFHLKKINFSLSFLDTEHFKYDVFPEITIDEFNKRENMYRYCLKKSLLTIVSQLSIKKEICKHYKLSADQVIVIPYTPSQIFNKTNRSDKIRKELKVLKNYIFYPAQIWGHKNHISILKAAKIIQKKGLKSLFVFSGLDRGFKKDLDNFIKLNNIKNIFFSGYLNSKEMDYVYKNCKGVIFTSLFGPDAIPPLEAWSYKKPLIYNNRFEDYVSKNTAITINIKNPKLISDAIIKILNNKYNRKFILNGTKKLNFVEKQSIDGYKCLNDRLDKLEKYLIATN